MIYKYLLFIVCFISCNKHTKNTIESDEHLKHELHKEYVFNLHDQNLEEVYRNQDFVNVLSVKHQIADSICTIIIVDYLNVINNQARNYNTQYKIETIKNYAFENDLHEVQVADLLHDYISYRDSKNNYQDRIYID